MLKRMFLEEYLGEGPTLDACNGANLFTYQGLVEFLATRSDESIAESLWLHVEEVAWLRDRTRRFAAAYLAGTEGADAVD